jgi:hypothetical protein
LKLVLTSALLGALFLVSGCATQCESVGNAYNTCKLTERSVGVDSANFCGLVDAFNQRAAAAGVTGCDAKWTTHLQCWQQHISSICDTTFKDCDASAGDWEDCVTAYCAQIATDSSKYDPECDSGDILIPSPFHSDF